MKKYNNGRCVLLIFMMVLLIQSNNREACCECVTSWVKLLFKIGLEIINSDSKSKI